MTDRVRVALRVRGPKQGTIVAPAVSHGEPQEIGSMSLLFTPFNGFSVGELVVLNRYRQRTA